MGSFGAGGSCCVATDAVAVGVVVVGRFDAETNNSDCKFESSFTVKLIISYIAFFNNLILSFRA